MRKGSKTSAFTLIELLVVVAIIALLLSILLPSLSGAREQGKRAKCLANLSSINKAMQQYANEDRVEQLIPIHSVQRKPTDYWLWRTANWFSWGGRSGQKAFKAGTNYGLTDEELPDAGEKRMKYAARYRPLNIYMLGDVGNADAQELAWFQCPSDTGYPDSADIDDSPPQNAERPCYDTLGNSYRASMACYIFATQHGPNNGNFAIGPWGHRASTLVDTGRLVLFGEPTFFNMIGRDDEAGIVDVVSVYGWHKRKLMDNVGFCDGSARSTKVEKQLEVDWMRMGLSSADDGSLFHRGTTYRLDTYPVGGAVIWGDWGGYLGTNHWPWKGAQDNFID